MRQIFAHVAAAIALGLAIVTARAQGVKPSTPARSGGDTQLVVVRLPRWDQYWIAAWLARGGRCQQS